MTIFFMPVKRVEVVERIKEIAFPLRCYSVNRACWIEKSADRKKSLCTKESEKLGALQRILKTFRQIKEKLSMQNNNNKCQCSYFPLFWTFCSRRLSFLINYIHERASILNLWWLRTKRLFISITLKFSWKNA